MKTVHSKSSLSAYICVECLQKKGNERRKGELRRTEREKRRTDNEQLFDKSTTLIEKQQSSEWKKWMTTDIEKGDLADSSCTTIDRHNNKHDRAEQFDFWMTWSEEGETFRQMSRTKDWLRL